jgi:hypothetical protein
MVNEYRQTIWLKLLGVRGWKKAYCSCVTANGGVIPSVASSGPAHGPALMINLRQR